MRKNRVDSQDFKNRRKRMREKNIGELSGKRHRHKLLEQVGARALTDRARVRAQNYFRAQSRLLFHRRIIGTSLIWLIM